MKLRARLTGLLARYGHEQRGASAVEFALIAAPFLVLLFGVLELGMVLLINSSLDQALGQASRTVRTGQITNANSPTVAGLRTALCNQIAWLGSGCTSNLNLDVRSFPSFAAVAAPPTRNGTNPALMSWNTGGPCSIVLVTAYYPWTLFAPVLNSALVNTGTNQRLIMATAIFKNEPYDPTAANSQC